MESLIKEMQDPETGVPVRSQKLFLSVIPSAFMGMYALLDRHPDRYRTISISRPSSGRRHY